MHEPQPLAFQKRLPSDVVLVADHGMASLESKEPIVVTDGLSDALNQIELVQEAVGFMNIKVKDGVNGTAVAEELSELEGVRREICLSQLLSNTHFFERVMRFNILQLL